MEEITKSIGPQRAVARSGLFNLVEEITKMIGYAPQRGVADRFGTLVNDVLASELGYLRAGDELAELRFVNYILDSVFAPTAMQYHPILYALLTIPSDARFHIRPIGDHVIRRQNKCGFELYQNTPPRGPKIIFTFLKTLNELHANGRSVAFSDGELLKNIY